MYELGIEHACILLSSTLTIVKDASVYLRHYRWCLTWVTRQVMSHLSGTTSVVSPEWHYRWCLTWLYLQVMSYLGDYRWCLTWVTLQVFSPEWHYRWCLTWLYLQVMSYPGDYRWCLTWVTLQVMSHLSDTTDVISSECECTSDTTGVLTWVYLQVLFNVSAFQTLQVYFLHILLCHTFNRALKYYFTNPSSGQTSMFWSILWLSGNQRNICRYCSLCTVIQLFTVVLKVNKKRRPISLGYMTEAFCRIG